MKKRVENAGSEKDQVEAMLTKADVELKGLRHTVHRLELENGNLTQRLLDAEQRQVGWLKTAIWNILLVQLSCVI